MTADAWVLNDPDAFDLDGALTCPHGHLVALGECGSCGCVWPGGAVVYVAILHEQGSWDPAPPAFATAHEAWESLAEGWRSYANDFGYADPETFAEVLLAQAGEAWIEGPDGYVYRVAAAPEE